ncbi:MAG: hypothetical protein WBN96_13680 [Gammaproteobacteria bacterium]
MPAYSDTVIDVLSMGHATQVLSDGHRARMDLPGEDGYMLVDYRSNGMLMVVPNKYQIIDMGTVSGDDSALPTPRVELIPRGNGPQIAGYDTHAYSLIAQGQNCGLVFGSHAAMRNREMSDLFAALRTMVDSQRNALGSFAAFMDVCTLASMDFAAHTDTTGMPLRMIDASGEAVSEIKNIDTDADVPAEMFEVPKGYKVVAMHGELTQVAESVAPAQKEYAPSNARRYKQRMRPTPYQ